MATSRDYDLLEEVWTKWRDAAGKPIRNDFKTYVDLQNKAARANGKKFDENRLKSCL